MARQLNAKGFTLIELMIVVAIIAILAGIGLPRLGHAVAKSKEGSTKGNLAVLRGAISAYYGVNEGHYPPNLQVLVPQYISKVPETNLPSHS